MSHLPRYRPYHPVRYYPRMPISWWVHKRAHVRFIVRELTSVFVMFFAIELVVLLQALGEGPAAYAAFLEWFGSPLALAVHTVAFAMVVFHSVTWFNLAPKAMVVYAGGRQVPAWAILAANYGAWLVVSAVLAALILV